LSLANGIATLSLAVFMLTVCVDIWGGKWASVGNVTDRWWGNPSCVFCYNVNEPKRRPETYSMSYRSANWLASSSVSRQLSTWTTRGVIHSLIRRVSPNTQAANWLPQSVHSWSRHERLTVYAKVKLCL
jgi:hypothetical protein